MCRRRRWRIGAALVLATGLGDATLIEPYRIETTRHVIGAHVSTPLKVLQLSDLHTHGFGRREQRTLEIALEEKPDVIVVTGDVVDGGDLEPARALFSQLHAPLGLWVVRGNWEHWKPPPNERAMFASFGATLLVNEGHLLRSDLWLVGLDDSTAGDPRIESGLAGAPPTATKMALFHSPEVFDRIAPQLDLAFAGHTHGGQVRLPFVPPLWTPPGSGRFVEGWYAAGTSRMFVSRGVGTSVLGIRFFCRPEIAVVTIRPM